MSVEGQRLASVRLAAHAMATRFECVLRGNDPRRLRSIGETALREVHALESRLNFYDERSELSRLNRTAARRPVRVAPDLLDILRLCRRMHQWTNGAFDPTVAALMSAWGFTGTGGRVPGPGERRRALVATGMDRVEINDAKETVHFTTSGVAIDLGGVAKGVALDSVRAVLEEHGVRNALVHGGTSTVLALGVAEDGRPWSVGLADPWSDEPEAWFRQTVVRDSSLSVSAVSGKSFIEEGAEYGHVIDPRSGEAVSGRLVGACVADSAAEADALSTAMLVLAPDEAPSGRERCARFVREEDSWSMEAGRWRDPGDG